jgi:glycosyltransferase involved in cell wall biosynthesis
LISIIIPVYNSEKTIDETIEALMKQNYSKKDYEIIVVDDGSTDRTVDVVKKFKTVKLVKQKHKGPAAARNIGVKHAKGGIILFTDADCIPIKNWIKNMVKPFKNKKIVGVSGSYRTLNNDKLVARFTGYEIADRHKSMEKQKNIDFIGTFSAGYRKDIFLKFKGFDESFPIASGEDPELSFKINKAGLNMVFQPKAFVYHKHPDSLKKYLKQKFWRAYWRIALYKKHKDKIFGDSYTPKSFYLELSLLGITCLLLFFGLLKIISLFFGSFFFLLVLFLTLPFSFKVFKKDKIVGLLSPLIIILRNFIAIFGIFFGLILLFTKSK